MDWNVSSSGGGFAVLAFLGAVIGIFTTVFWMYVGWRAMKAHERIAQAVDQYARDSKIVR